MRRAAAVLRLLVAAAIVAAVVTTHVEAAIRLAEAGLQLNLFNIYGYFTIQSNLIGAVGLVAGGVVALRGRPESQLVGTLRALGVTCLVIVGLVYAVLLAPLAAAGGVPVPWANTVLHIVSPIFVVVDWILVRDRPSLPLRRVWWILAYPLVWTAVVLIRGATDGWVPYPFLDPAQGYGVVAAYAAAIAALFVGVGLLVLWVTRLRGPASPR